MGGERQSKTSQISGDLENPGESELSGESSLTEGNSISEAALWMEWHNCGRLTSSTESYLISLSAPNLEEAVKQHLGAYARAVVYARAFVERLKEQGALS